MKNIHASVMSFVYNTSSDSALQMYKVSFKYL